jgi:hypothetical protein
MIVSAHKICDKCKDIVARRNCICFYTVKDYVTVKGSDVTTYANMEDNDTPYKLHYCWTCWDGFVGKIEVDV